MTSFAQAFRFDGSGGVGRKNSKIQRLACRCTIVSGRSLYSKLASLPSNRRAAARKRLTVLSFAGYVIYLVLDKTQATNGVADSSDRFTNDRTAFDMASVKPLWGGAFVDGKATFGSFLANRRRGEMRSPVFAHVTRKIRRFVSEDSQRQVRDNGTRIHADIRSTNAIFTQAIAQTPESPTRQSTTVA